MNISIERFRKFFGIKKVLLRYNEIPIVAWQEIKKGEVLDEKWFNRFTYESAKNMYDVEIEVNTTNVKYFQNMKECEKNKYHGLIEQHFVEDIKKTIGVL